MANSLVEMNLLVLSYGTISEIPVTGPVPPHTPESLTHIDFYMDDVISALQGDPDHQYQVFDRIFRSLKWLFPSLPGDIKDSVGMKNLLVGEGGCTCVK